MVILDSPAAGVVTDAAVLAPQVDGTLLVIAAGAVPAGQAGAVRDMLEAVGGRVLGVVLNGVPGAARAYTAYVDGTRAALFAFPVPLPAPLAQRLERLVTVLPDPLSRRMVFIHDSDRRAGRGGFYVDSNALVKMEGGKRKGENGRGMVEIRCYMRQPAQTAKKPVFSQWNAVHVHLKQADSGRFRSCPASSCACPAPCPGASPSLNWSARNCACAYVDIEITITHEVAVSGNGDDLSDGYLAFCRRPA